MKEPEHNKIQRRKSGKVAPGSAWALVTGAGSGIGHCYAMQLAALGYNLVVVGNSLAPLEAVAKEIRQSFGSGSNESNSAPDSANSDSSAKSADTIDHADGITSGQPHATHRTGQTDLTAPVPYSKTSSEPGKAMRQVRIIAMDLARIGAAEELYEKVAQTGIEIDVLINNAGIFSFCDILATPPERIERIILLHDLTVTKLCRLYAGEMIRRGVRGHILNMASFSLWMPFPGLSLYSASKAYMHSFSVAFAKEVREHGIRVTAVCPAGVATNLYGLTPHWQQIGKRLGVLITPDSCARRGLKAMWRGRRSIVPDWWNRIWIPFCKMLPMWAIRPIRRFTLKFQR